MSRARKLGAKILIFRRIAGFDNVLALRSEKLEERRRVIVLRCINGRLNGLLRGRKCPLGVLWARLAVRPPTTKPTATSHVSRRGLSFESIELVFPMILAPIDVHHQCRRHQPPPPRPPPPREAAAAPGRPRLEYPWSLCVRAAPPSRTPPKALRFCAGALGGICRLPIRSVPDWGAPRACACPADPRDCRFCRTVASIAVGHGSV